MQKKEKRVAAALAAVQLYLQQEEAEARSRMDQADQCPVAAIDPGYWAQAGRLEMMSVRRMMQMRAFSRTR